MHLIQRFSPLFDSALHYSGTAAGLTLPLTDVQAALIALVEQERTLSVTPPTGQLPDFSEERQHDLNICRFAVYVFTDEKLLNANRPDAAAWMPLALQCRYFGTSEGGTQFFTQLDTLLTRLSVPAQNRDGDPLDLAQRLELAANTPPDTPGKDVLQVCALCLLYGFSGKLYTDPQLLARVRKACYALLPRFQEAPLEQPSPRGESWRTLLHTLEPALWLLIPVIACVCFWFYCGDILANIPVKGL